MWLDSKWSMSLFLVLNHNDFFHCSSFRSGFDRGDRPMSWCESPTTNSMRQAMFSSQAGQREYLIKHRLGKKENEFVDIQNFRWEQQLHDPSINQTVLIELFSYTTGNTKCFANKQLSTPSSSKSIDRETLFLSKALYYNKIRLH